MKEVTPVPKCVFLCYNKKSETIKMQKGSTSPGVK